MIDVLPLLNMSTVIYVSMFSSLSYEGITILSICNVRKMTNDDTVNEPFKARYICLLLCF